MCLHDKFLWYPSPGTFNANILYLVLNVSNVRRIMDVKARTFVSGLRYVVNIFHINFIWHFTWSNCSFGPVPVKNNKFHKNFLKATIINYCSSFNFDLRHLRQSLYFSLVGQLDRFMIWNARLKPLKVTYSDILFYILKASQLGYVLLHVPLYIYCQFNYRVLRFPTASACQV